MGKALSSHIIHSLRGEYCWIVRDSEPIRLLKSPRSLNVYILSCIIFLKISCRLGRSFFFFQLHFITCMLCVFSKSYAILFMIILNFVFLENSLQSWTKLLRKLHSWGAFFLNFVADRFSPPPSPSKQCCWVFKTPDPWTFVGSNFKLGGGGGGGGQSLRKAVDLEIALLR